jgi:hypothetical protein
VKYLLLLGAVLAHAKVMDSAAWRIYDPDDRPD